jgi:hypothetical protein
MTTMKTKSVDASVSEKLLWQAFEECRSIPFDSAKLLVLEVLLWARWLPESVGDTIGFFDVFEEVCEFDEWEAIRIAVYQSAGIPRHRLGKWYSLDQDKRLTEIPQESREFFSDSGDGSINGIRSLLLPLGRILNSDNPEEIKKIIHAFLAICSQDRRGPGLGYAPSIASLLECLLRPHEMQSVACLFPGGLSVAPNIAWEHPILMACPNNELKAWILALMSLYPKQRKPELIADNATWPLAIAAPPWGEKSRDLLEVDDWLPPSPLDCPSAIKDSEARRVFAAHQRCSGTTYALVSAGIGFRTSRDLEFFREELVRKNWLDAVVALPAGAWAGTRLEGLLLVLKQDRQIEAPIQMVAAHDLLIPNKERSTRQDWDSSGVNELAQLLNDKKDGSYSRLVSAKELEVNGFSFQVSRYLHSQADLVLLSYLGSRPTAQLGDLAEIKRPVASLGRQEDDGIEVREVAPGDIDDSGQLHQGSKLIRLPEAALAKGRQHLLEPGDVLLSIKGSLGKVAVVQDLEHDTVPGQAFCVVRLRPNAPITPTALVQYLRSAVGQTLLNKAGQGAVVSFMPMGEVKALPVVIPHPNELKRAETLEEESVALNRELEVLSRRLKRLSRQGWMDDLPTALLSSVKGEGG